MPTPREFWRPLLTAWLLCGAGAALPAAVPAAGGLQGALQATLRNHPAIAGQQAEIEAKRYAADGARSQRYPTLSAQAQQYAESDRSVLSGDDLSHPAILRVRQPIWAFGRIGSSIAFADAEVGTERADLLRVRRQLMEDTAVAYALVRGNQAIIDIARGNVAEHDALLAQIERRVEGQLASSADARLAATRLTQARAQLERARGEWEIARQDLYGLTQEPVDTAQRVPTGLLELSDDAVLEQAMDNSAEIRVKEQQLGQAEAEVNRARTSYMPTIYLQADRLYDQPGLRDDNQVSVVFEGSLEGLGFAARGRRGEAIANRTAAAEDLAAARLELRREVERLRRSRQLQHDLIALQAQSVAELESLVDSYQRQYESGTKSWLDLMNLQREVYEQRRQLVQAESDWRIHSLQLLARTGALDDLAVMAGDGDG